MERERRVENEPSQEEYSFDEGLKEVNSRIDALLEEQDYVVVGISGPMLDIDVGKTTLKGEIWRDLSSRQIPAVTTFDGDHVDDHTIEKLKREQDRWKSSQGVIILSATDTARYVLAKRAPDRELKDMSEKYGLPLSGIDIGILLYRPDRIPDQREKDRADVLINNEKAKDKKGTQ